MSCADTMALCWRIERRDGAGLALTSHDRPITHDGRQYEPAPGLLPATIIRRGGLQPSSGDIDGAISAKALTEADLELGRWSGASIRLDVVRWDDPTAPVVCLMAGEIGEVTAGGAAFSAALVGRAAGLDAAVCPSTSSECRAELGDRECRVDMAGRRSTAAVVDCESERLAIEPAAEDRHVGGRLVVIEGPSCGWASPIVGVDAGVAIMRDLPRLQIAAGTRVWIEEGCDKRFSTCCARFANAVNFRGEPHLPGNDLLTRYPGG